MKMGRDEQAVRDAFRRMGPREKFGYILTYYWWAILLSVIAAVILGSVIHGRVTKKQMLLYIACLNVSAGSDLEESLREGYLRFAVKIRRRPMCCSTGICIFRRILPRLTIRWLMPRG